ncbi:MAG TPA: PilN domain-containing protein [Longimicrobiales bacterium]
MRRERARAAGRRSARRQWRRRTLHLGLAVGPERVVAVQLRRTLRGVRPGRVLARDLAPPEEDRGWPGLTAALIELRRELGAAGGRLDIALLRPFGHAKVLRLPPVRGRALSALVARNARRYFLVGVDPALTGVRPIPGRLALVGCAPDAAVERITAAVTGAGFRIGGITPASAALVEAVRTLVPGVRRGRTAILADSPGCAELLLLERGAPRRIEPRSAPLGEEVDAAVRAASADGAVPDRVVICGEEAGRAASDARPARVALPDAAALAAYGAVLLAGAPPQLLPSGLEAELRHRAGGRSVRLAAAAAGLLVAAGALHLRGLGDELAAVEARRRALSAAVAEAFTAKRSVEDVRARLEAIGNADAERTDWIGLFAELARTLPDSAYLVSLAADSGRLRIEGSAASASSVVPALEGSPWFRDVALAAPVLLNERGAGERFTITLDFEAPAAHAGVRPERTEAPREDEGRTRAAGGRLARRDTP